MDGNQVGNQFRVELLHVVYQRTAGGGDGGRCVFPLQILAVGPGNDVGASGGVVESLDSEGLQVAEDLVGSVWILQPQNRRDDDGTRDPFGQLLEENLRVVGIFSG